MLRRFILLSFLGTALIGCGFHPMYTSVVDTKEVQNFDIHIKGEGFPAYKFRRELEKQLAIMPRISNDTYRLDITVTEALSAATYAKDASVARAKATLTANYVLKQKDRQIAADKVYVVSSYPIISADEFISRTAEKAAVVRTSISLAEDVAREIIRRLQRTEIPLKDVTTRPESSIVDDEVSFFTPFDRNNPNAIDPIDSLDLATPGY